MFMRRLRYRGSYPWEFHYTKGHPSRPYILDSEGKAVATWSGSSDRDRENARLIVELANAAHRRESGDLLWRLTGR